MRWSIKYLVFIYFFSILNSTVIQIPEDYLLIQDGLDIASTGDTISVQPGVYLETIWWPPTHGIKLIGSGVDTTTIDGNQEYTVIVFPGFPQGAQYDTTTVLKDLSITGGNGHNGSGVRVVLGSPLLENIVVHNCTSSGTMQNGGGIGIFDSNSILLRNVTVVDNQIIGNGMAGGAGISCLDSEVVLTNVIVAGNSGGWFGGGIHIENSIVTVNGGIISGNSSEHGAGINVDSSDLFLNNVEITGNTATEGGGGMRIFSAPGTSWHNITANESNIVNNLAGWGGGIQCDARNGILLRGFNIIDNYSDESCGMYISNGTFYGEKLTIAGNDAIQAAGSELDNVHATFDFCTFSNNNSAIGPSILLDESYLSFTNSIAWENEVHEFGFSNGVIDTLVIAYSLVQGSGEDIDHFEDQDIALIGDGIFDDDPLFVDSNGFNYALEANSPCIDAGDPNTEFDPDNTIADIGAIYFDQGPCIGYILGDVNQDGTLDVLDIVEIVNCIVFGCQSPECIAWTMDVNEDSNINVLDIIQLVFDIL